MKSFNLIIAGVATLTALNCYAANPSNIAAQIAGLKKSVIAQEQALNMQKQEIAKLTQQYKVLKNSRSTDVKAKTKLSTSNINSHNDVNLQQENIVIGSKNTNVSVSGQLNFLALHTNDGSKSNTFVAGNSNSNSRINVDAKTTGANGLTAGANLQLGFELNPSDGSGVSNNSTSYSNNVNVRKAEAYLASNTLGSVTFGQGNSASDNTSEVDLSGTTVVGYSSVADVGGAMVFRNTDGTTALGSTTGTTSVGSNFNNLDGYGRQVRVMYKTPTFNGFNVAASLVQNNRKDISVWYNHDFSGTKVAGAIAYMHNSNVTGVTGHGVDGSLSVLLPFGLSVTGAGGKLNSQAATRNDPHFYYFKLGYQHGFFNLGTTAMSVDYGRYFYMANNNQTGKTIGAQLVQNLNSLHTAVYAGWRRFLLNTTVANTSYYGINEFMIGTIYKF